MFIGTVSHHLNLHAAKNTYFISVSFSLSISFLRSEWSGIAFVSWKRMSATHKQRCMRKKLLSILHRSGRKMYVKKHMYEHTSSPNCDKYTECAVKTSHKCILCVRILTHVCGCVHLRQKFKQSCAEELTTNVARVESMSEKTTHYTATAFVLTFISRLSVYAKGKCSYIFFLIYIFRTHQSPFRPNGIWTRI